MKQRRAMFISVEGLEGSGKSSVINYLRRLLTEERFTVKVYREPGTTGIGEKIRKILLDKNNRELSRHTELLLYLAARTQLIEERLRKDMSRYDFVICDRFFDSTLVYQGYALGLGKIAATAVKIFSLGVEPDLTLFLDTPVKDGLSRLKQRDRIESRPVKFHNRLRRGYLQLVRQYPHRIIRVNATGDLKTIYQVVREIIGKVISRRKKKRK